MHLVGLIYEIVCVCVCVWISTAVTHGGQRLQ